MQKCSADLRPNNNHSHDKFNRFFLKRKLAIRTLGFLMVFKDRCSLQALEG